MYFRNSIKHIFVGDMSPDLFIVSAIPPSPTPQPDFENKILSDCIDSNEFKYLCLNHKKIWLIVSLIGRKDEVFYLTTHSTHFIYGYIASDIW